VAGKRRVHGTPIAEKQNIGRLEENGVHFFVADEVLVGP
jgi:hypothetical protein